MHLCPRGTDNEQDRWDTGCAGVSTCQTHVMGGAGVSRPFYMCTVGWERTSSTSYPPKIYVYICMAIYNIEVCTPVQSIFATNH